MPNATPTFSPSSPITKAPDCDASPTRRPPNSSLNSRAQSEGRDLFSAIGTGPPFPATAGLAGVTEEGSRYGGCDGGNVWQHNGGGVARAVPGGRGDRD